MRRQRDFIDLCCPTCGQCIRVWEGVEASCVGREGKSHRRAAMKRVRGEDEAMEGQASLPLESTS